MQCLQNAEILKLKQATPTVTTRPQVVESKVVLLSVNHNMTKSVQMY